MKWYPIHSNSKWNQIRLSLTHRNSLIKDYGKCFVIAMWKVANTTRIQHCISKARKDAGEVLFGSIFCPLWDARHSQTLFANDQEHLCTRTLKVPVAIPKMPLGTSASELWRSLLGIQKSFSELCVDPGHLASCVVAGNSPGHSCGRHARKPSPELFVGNLVETLGLTRFPPDAF